MIKYGKSYKVLLSKNDTFANNDELSKLEEKHIQNYIKSPKREFCINCKNKLEKLAFIRKGIQYFQCERCGHINGEYKITSTFNNYLYNSLAYDSNYLEFSKQEYLRRAEEIYIPKAKFLIDSLDENQVNKENLTFFDFGCGAGYFVYAMQKLGIKNIQGSDVSERQIALGNTMLQDFNNQTDTENLKISDTLNFAELNINCLSLIGVLEHLESPNDFLTAIAKNDIEYIYVLVPTFSLSNYLQIAFPSIYERHLGSGHTHLYTENSLKSFFEKFNYVPVSEWWFGGDIFDLFRSLSVTLNNESANIELFNDYFKNLIDDLQLTLDKHHKCSEVHMLFKKVT